MTLSLNVTDPVYMYMLIYIQLLLTQTQVAQTPPIARTPCLVKKIQNVVLYILMYNLTPGN